MIVLSVGFGGSSDPPAPATKPDPGIGAGPVLAPNDYEYDTLTIGPYNTSPDIPFIENPQPIKLNPPPVPVLLSPPPKPLLIPAPPRPSPSPSPQQQTPEKRETPPPPENKKGSNTDTSPPPVNTVLVPSGKNPDAAEKSTQGSSMSSTTVIIIAVACSVGGVIAIAVFIIMCFYCSKKRKTVATNSGDMETGRPSVESDASGSKNSKSFDPFVLPIKASSGRINDANGSNIPLQNADRAAESTFSSAKVMNKAVVWLPPDTVGSNGAAPSAAVMGPMAAAASNLTMYEFSSKFSDTKSFGREQEVSSPGPKNRKDATAVWLGMKPVGTTRSESELRKRDSSSTLMSSYYISFSTIDICEPIGQGSFGKIYRAVWNETPVAVKLLSPWQPQNRFEEQEFEFQQTQTEKLLSALESEAEILSSLRHPNIVQFIGVCSEPACIISEFCQKGSVCDLLRAAKKAPNGLPPWMQCLSILTDAATGMLYLHARSSPIIHCDLKSTNILLDSHFRAKICDFNMSRLLEESTGSSLAAMQNPRWLAPEVLDGEGHSKASDVYSFGMVMWEVLTQHVPWPDVKSWEIVSLIRDGARPPVPNFWDAVDGQGQECIVFDEYVNLMTSCWSQNPYDRPSFAEIVRELKDMSLLAGPSMNRADNQEDNSSNNIRRAGMPDPALLSDTSTRAMYFSANLPMP